MAIHEIVPLLRCLHTSSPLYLADTRTVETMNTAIQNGQVRNCLDQVQARHVDGLLFNEEKTIAYPIYSAIPVLTRDDAIHVESLRLDVALEKNGPVQ